MKIIELDKEEFISFSKNYPYSMFFQSPYWIDVKKQNGWSGKIIGVKEKGKIIAATILLFKNIKGINKKMVYAPRGFLIDYSDYKLLGNFVECLKKYLKKEKAVFLKINPYVKYQERDINGDIIPNTKNNELINKLKKMGFHHQGFYIKMDDKKDLEPRWVSALNVENKNVDDIFKDMRTLAKRSIRSSENNCLKIIECNREQLKEFKSLMQHTANRREFIDRPLSYYQNLYDVLSKDGIAKFLVVEINFKELLSKTEENYLSVIDKIEKIGDNIKKQGQKKTLDIEKESLENKIEDLKKYIDKWGETKIIAGGLYMLYGKQLVYLLGASYKEFMKYNSQYLLQWEMIKYAINNNYQTFNFYGIDGDFSESSKNYGLFDFKRGFGSEVVELIGEFDLVINKPFYYLYTFAYKIYRTLKNILNKKRKS